MSTSPAKTLSPAELAKLENAFASDPSSEAYRPLAEAYLAAGRFMEAMVVCKKGAKAHPTKAEPRLLLARVYSEQGKDRKALEEALGALQAVPTDKAALRLAGSLQLKLGEADAGKANLLKAYAADPADADTRAAMAQHKVEPPAAAAPPAPVAAAPVARAPAAGGPPVLTPVDAPTVRAPTHDAPTVRAPVASQPAGNGAPARGPASAAAPRAAGPARTASAAATPAAARPVRRTVDPETYAADHDEDEPHYRPRRKGRGASKAFTIGLAVLLPLLAVGYFGYGRWSAQRSREFKKQLTAASEQLKRDSFDSYKKAIVAADAALDVDEDSGAAHGYLAYAWAVRWGEHGGGDEARRAAEEHLKAAHDAGEESSHLYAADALFRAYQGKGAEALKALEERVRTLEAQGKRSGLLYLTLGMLQMRGADLERARDSMEKAKEIAQDDPRVYSALGALYRRRGQDGLAYQNYDFALRYEKEHHESMLGVVLLMLDRTEPNYELVGRMLKRVLDADPPPSPRQLAQAHMMRSLLASRLSTELPDYKADFQQTLVKATGIPADRDAARAIVAQEEQAAFAGQANDPELYLLKARRLRFEGNPDAAAAQVRRAIELDKDRAELYVELSRALMAKEGGAKEAAEALQTAIRTMGESPKLVVMLGDALRRQGKADEAIAQYQRAVASPTAKNPEARLALGQLYRERNELPRAREALEKANQELVGQSERQAVVLTELGRVYAGLNDAKKAEDAFQKALQADPDYAPVYFHYAAALQKGGQAGEKVKTLAQEYLKREPRGEYAADAQRL